MHIHIFEDYTSMSAAAAQEIVTVIRNKPNAVICLAAGHTPEKAYEIFVKTVLETKSDLSRVQFLGLDEWVGISPDDTGSCHYFLTEKLLKPLSIQENHYHLFDVSNQDLYSECQRMDDLISTLGGIDLFVVGIGMNGHIGFNEPGTSFHLKCHVADLSESTKIVGRKYFSGDRKLRQGISIGLKHLIDSKRTLLVASGKSKSTIVSQALYGKVSTSVPASIIRLHPAGAVLLDRAAASNLKENSFASLRST